MMGMVGKILRKQVIKDLVTQAYHKPLALVGESASHLSTNLWRSPMGAPQLQGLGIRSSITGKHAWYVITDDICNKDDRESRAERERTKNKYDELQKIRNKGGRMSSRYIVGLQRKNTRCSIVIKWFSAILYNCGKPLKSVAVYDTLFL